MHTVQTRFATPESRWQALRNRDPAADGHFLYSVDTTGVYCRPSCSARPALPRNVRFHTSNAEAEQAGYRPCKRCRPDLPPRAEREAAVVAAACRALEQSDQSPTLGELAARAKLSPFHFHRLFKRVTGVTPRAYAAAHRQRRTQESLRAAPSVTDALYEAGFNSSGRFYENAPAMLGMTPSSYRRGGAGETLWHAVVSCSLGRALVAGTARGLCAIMLGDDDAALREELTARFARATLVEPPAEFGKTVAQVVRWVDDPSRSLELPLDIRGTVFQRRVWEELRRIPAGTTVTYSELAARIGHPRAVRAVGSACGANPLAVAIPCHRVVGRDGSLTGYRWGTERKRRLLEQEGKRRK